MTREYRYAGPGGGNIAALPPGTGAALGSEYCAHLLPGAEEMEKALSASRDLGIPLLLLTPYFRDAELAAALRTFRSIPGGADVLVAVNDWGALLALRRLLPGLGLTVGRLLSGQKRCPRIRVSRRLTEVERAWHAEGLFSSPRAVKYLTEEFGVLGFHVDDLPVPAGRGSSGETESPEPVPLFVHSPYAIVTVSDHCPWLGGRSSSSVEHCPRPCREGVVVLREPSMGEALVQRGKARFVRTGGGGGPESRGEVRGRVLYDEEP